MALIWYVLSEDIRKQLVEYQWKRWKKRLNQPDDNTVMLVLPGPHIEGLEEIDHILRSPPGPKWRDG